MKRLAIISGVIVIVVVASIIVWYSLDSQARGVVLGVLLGVGGLFLGAVLAFAVVGMLLLWKLVWQVQQQPPRPMILPTPGQVPALPPGQDWQPAPRRRIPRDWRILGRDATQATFPAERPWEIK